MKKILFLTIILVSFGFLFLPGSTQAACALGHTDNGDGTCTAAFYPDANPESTSFDGYAWRSSLNSSWVNLLYSGGTGYSNLDSSLPAAIYSGTIAWNMIIRSVTLFNTQSLPDTANILSAVYSIYGRSKSNTFSSGSPTVNVYSSSPLSNNQMTASDYNALGSIKFSDTDITYAAWNTAGYNNFNLNSAGLAAISKIGVTKLGIRESSYDGPDNPPPWEASKEMVMMGYSADQTGTSQDPKLIVTYSDPSFLNNVSGWAWSKMDDSTTATVDEGQIGWISFNSLNCDTDNNGSSNGGTGCPSAETAMARYGVTINSNGTFTGYAWSDSIGWIYFAPAGPYPVTSPDTQYPACIDFPGNGQACDGIGNYNIGGWARALSYGGGWEGWIHLRGVAQNGSPYGVSVNSSNGDFSGNAWSDLVIGRISFSGVTYKVQTTLTFNSPPSKPDVLDFDWNECSIRGGVQPSFSWIYSDPDNVPAGADPQTAYEVEVDDNSSFTAPKFNHLVTGASGGSTSYVLNLSEDDDSDWITQFAWNNSYFFRIRVRDSFGNWSEFSNSSQSKTDKHASPWVDIDYDPPEPTQREIVEFRDLTEPFGETSIVSRLWSTTTAGSSSIFTDGTTAIDQNPHIKFYTKGINTVRLEVIDSDGYSCYQDKDIIIQLPLPDYQEISPIGWIKKIFTGLLAFLTNF